MSTSKRDPIPHETTRDEAWAAPMERAIEQFTRRRLEEFIPSLRWDGARCMTTTCVISYRVPASEWKLARYLHSVALGPSTYRTNHLSDAGDGMTRVDLLVSYVDPRSEVLVSADEYLSSRAKYNSHYEKVKANLDQLKAELARDP